MIAPADILRAKILIVDDQQANILLLEGMLRGAGYTSVTSSMRPNDVCGLHEKNRYELIILDLKMPVMDGFEVMKRLHECETGGYLPVLVLTAQPDQKLRALHAGARDFVSKPFDIAEVQVRVRNMIEVRLLHQEMRRLYDQVVAERNVSERLLRNVLPHSIAERLKGRSLAESGSFTDMIADSFTDVTVLFADIVGFTRFSESVSAEDLVDILNDLFTCFDDIADARGLEKITTIGDCYMAAAGLPLPAPDHARRAAHMALDMIEAVERFRRRRHIELNVRIGINSGAVVAGVIGKRKFRYDVWGEVVNTASRMESHGLPGRIHMTDATRRRLDELFEFEKRGSIDVKGMGEMRTWFLNSRNA